MSSNHMFDNDFLKVCLAAMLAIGLTACSSSSDGGGSTGDDMTMTEPDPSAYETAKADIAAAETEAAARAAVATAVAAGITGAQLQSLEMAVEARIAALAEAAAAEQRQALVTAAECDDATPACLMAHEALVAALMEDLAALRADDDATNAQEQAAQMAIDEAEEDRDMIRMALNDATRDTDIGMKVTDAEMKASALEDDLSDAALAAAKAAITAAKMAIADGDDPDAYMAEIEAAELTVAWAEEIRMVEAAIEAATAAVDGLEDDSGVDAVAEAQRLIDVATAAIEGTELVSEVQAGIYSHDVAGLQRAVTIAESRNEDDAEADRMAAEADKRKANEARAATAAKLYAGIGSAPLTGHAVTVAADTGVWSVDPADVPPANLTNQALAEDKKTPVADHHGWKGARHTAEPTGDFGTYEAVVYSNVQPTEGDPFNEEYTLLTTAAGGVDVGEVGVDTSDAAVAGRVASSSFDQSAGTKQFTLPTNALRVIIPGSYHGVSGNFYCTPTNAETKCASTIAASGFTLVGGTWAFKPGTPTAKVTDTADTVYASYGWWLHTSEDGATLTVSAFAEERGTPTAASGITALLGTATYMGGAAGHYALSSTTGGTNDAGAFTARATLEADFNADMISGTIDQFMGADGQSRNWSVELKKSGVGDTGAITGSDGTGDPMETVWTIDGTAGTAGGQWSGTLFENGEDDGVPTVATGTFHSTNGPGNRMVGAFGANKQ